LVSRFPGRSHPAPVLEENLWKTPLFTDQIRTLLSRSRPCRSTQRTQSTDVRENHPVTSSFLDRRRPDSSRKERGFL